MPLFSRRTDPVATTGHPNNTYTNTRTSVDSNGHRRSTGGGLFSSRRRNSSTSSSDIETRRTSHTGGGLSNMFHRNHEDPSISAARERVIAAERAEKEADAALAQARVAVREAREHVKILEREAAEEARLAKIKQGHARDLGKRAKPLGRFGI